MKPTEPLNRERLLQVVQRVLSDRSGSEKGSRASHQSGSPSEGDGTLGLVVRQIMAALQEHATSQQSEEANLTPVPLYDVAAYIDGKISDDETLEAITRAAASDPGLMMEIVAALRSRQSQSHSRLPDQLRNRLLNIKRTDSSGDLQDEESVKVGPGEAERQKSIASSIASELGDIAIQTHEGSAKVALPDRGDQDRVSGWAPGSWAPGSRAPGSRAPGSRAPGSRAPGSRAPGRLSPVLTFVVAAMLFFAIGWWVRSSTSPDEVPVAVDPERIDDPDPRTREELDRESTPPSSEPLLVEQPPTNRSDPDSSETPTPRQSPIDLTPPSLDETNPSGDETKLSPRNVATDDDRQNEPMMMVVDDPNSDFERPVVPTRQPPSVKTSKPLVAKWSQIDGLLLRSVSLAQPAANASLSADHALTSITDGSSLTLSSPTANERLRIQSLPLCRAVAQLDGGGRLVVGSDTLVELNEEGVVNLQYGSLALLELNAATPIRLGPDHARSVSLASDGGGVVVRRTLAGLEIETASKSVRINSQSFQNSTVSIDGPRRTVTRVGDAPDSLPRWTRQRVDRIEVGRTILAQLSESPDVRSTMVTSLRSGKLNGNAAAIIRGWIVATSRDSLRRLIGSGDALLREAALRHLAAVHPKDPRHRVLWRNMQAGTNNARNQFAARTFFVELWAGRRPNQTRREQLLRMLQSRDLGTRAIANFLLQSFYGPGPRFDPASSNQSTQARAINAWRQVINRVDRG